MPTGSWPAARPRRERQPTETGPGSSGQEIASTLTERRSPDAPIRVGRPASCLSFCLIHLRPAPFTRDRPSRVRAGHGRRWTSVNGGQHCWKACWGQPLASSNLASSATSDQAIHQAGHPLWLLLRGCTVSFPVSFFVIYRYKWVNTSHPGTVITAMASATHPRPGDGV